jgi:hypothetical protein
VSCLALTQYRWLGGCHDLAGPRWGPGTRRQVNQHAFCPEEEQERLVWADNETDVDLLGFDFLVDALVVALTEPGCCR